MKIRFGLSCEIEGDMNALGHILAIMKIHGAQSIGYEVIEQSRKQPALLPAPKKQYKNKDEAIREYLNGIPVGEQVLTRDVMQFCRTLGYSSSAPLNMLDFIRSGQLERIGLGKYVRKAAA